MLFGIGLIGMITGSIATYFIGGEEKQKVNVDVDYIKKQLDHYNELNVEDINIMINMLEKIKKEKEVVIRSLEVSSGTKE